MNTISGVCQLVHNCYMSIIMTYIQSVWRIMHNYHKIKKWHDSADSRRLSNMDGNKEEDAFNRNYVQTKLENGLLRVWRVRCGN